MICHIADIQQLCGIPHLGGVAGMAGVVALLMGRISQLLCHIDRHAAFHQLLHVITAVKLAVLGIHNAVGMVLHHAVKAQLFCQQKHGNIHIDACKHLFDLFSIVIYDTGILGHCLKTHQIQHTLIHFGNFHRKSSLL